MTERIIEGASYDVFLKENNLPIQGNPVRVLRFEKRIGKVDAVDSQMNNRIFSLSQFFVRPVSAKKVQSQ
jgi:hypothetical protein